MYLNQCPWSEQTEARNLQMILITEATINQTVILTLFLLLSHGWMVTRKNLPRQVVSEVVLIVGLIYLLNSAYHIT